MLHKPALTCTLNTIRPGSSPSNQIGTTVSQDMPSLPPLVDTLRRDSPQSNHQNSLQPPKASDSVSNSRSPVTDPSTNAVDLKTSRSLHMHNILNPTSNTEAQHVATPNESPQTSVSSLSWRPSDRLTQSPSDMSVGSSSLPGLKGYSTSSSVQLNRPNLASAPYNNRNYNIGLGTPSATIDAKSSLFLGTQTSALPPRSGASLLPSVSTGVTPPVATRASYGFPHQQTSPPDRRGLEVMTHASSTRSESPSTSISSFSQMSRASPGPQQYHLPQGHTHPTQFNHQSAARPPAADVQGPRMGAESSYGPLTGANGQATYQLFTLETDQGPIQVPVDVQAASKMADEKRKRNAGASARFRARRKEKERESSQTIANLESKIRTLDEEKEYYRMERDYFRGVVYSTPGQPQIPPRLPSPRHRKGNLADNAGQGQNGSWQQAEERGSQNGRNTRRRISANLSYGMQQPSSTGSKQSPAFSPPQPLSYPPHGSQVMLPGARPSMPAMPLTPGAYQPPTPPMYERQWNPGR